MATVNLYDNNHTGLYADITFSAWTGGSSSLGIQNIPYTFTADYPYGTYSLYYSSYSQTCSVIILPNCGGILTTSSGPPYSVTLDDSNYSGYSANITYTPLTGGTVSLGTQNIPYTFSTNYYYGSYSLFYNQFNKTCGITSTPDCNTSSNYSPNVYRYALDLTATNYPENFYNCERWKDVGPDGTPWQMELNSMILNGVEYASGQILNISFPDDLVVGMGVLGINVFVQNINDWINSIPGVSSTGFVFYDGMTVIDLPLSNSTFTICLKLNYPGLPCTYTYSNEYNNGIYAYGNGNTTNCSYDLNNANEYFLL